MNALLHGHHFGLISWGRGYEERKEQILRLKPEREHPIRLRCLQVITEEMLEDLPGEVVETRRASGEAYRSYQEAVRAYGESNHVSVEAWRAYDEAYHIHVDALYAHSADLEAWHQRWCSAIQTPEGCPWDGERLVGVGE